MNKVRMVYPAFREITLYSVLKKKLRAVIYYLYFIS